jgi:antitoxin StbD
MTEKRGPHKVFKTFGTEPVAILRNSTLVGYIIPADAVSNQQHLMATIDDQELTEWLRQVSRFG